MAQFDSQYSNELKPVDDYDPVHHTAAGGAPISSTHNPQHLRSGSSSSSSSEDDGLGGRRKKIKDKVKDKIPGVGNKDNQPHGATTTPVGHEQTEKKGMMDKIKEKLPGQHN